MVVHPYSWPTPTKTAFYDELKAVAHKMAKWLDGKHEATVQHTGVLFLDWSLLGDRTLATWYPAIYVTQRFQKPDPNMLTRNIICHGYPPKLDRGENKPSKAYFRWEDNPFNYNTGIDWFLSTHMDPKTWDSLAAETKEIYHPCGPTFQIAPWLSVENIDHWMQVTDDRQEAKEDRSKVLRPVRIPLQWYPLEPHYCHWDEFKDKEFEFE